MVAAHSNQQRDGKGMGLKAHDYRIAALCFKCHADIDQGKSLSKQQKFDAWDEAIEEPLDGSSRGVILLVNRLLECPDTACQLVLRFSDGS